LCDLTTLICRYKKKELPDPEFASRLQKSELAASFHPLRHSGSLGSVRKSSRDTPQDLDVELSSYIADIDDIIRKDSTGGGGEDSGGRTSGRTSAAGKVVVWPPATDSRVTTPELVTPPPTYAPLARLERHTLGLGADAEEESGGNDGGRTAELQRGARDIGAAEIYEEAIRYNRSQNAQDQQAARHRAGSAATRQELTYAERKEQTSFATIQTSQQVEQMSMSSSSQSFQQVSSQSSYQRQLQQQQQQQQQQHSSSGSMQVKLFMLLYTYTITINSIVYCNSRVNLQFSRLKPGS
jgi:hypothetical protein